MGKPMGPRVTVLYGTKKGGTGKDAKKGTAQYVYMLKSTAEALGFKIIPDAFITRSSGKNSKSKIQVPIRGSFGAKHIKVPRPSSQGKKKGYFQIPVPANANIKTIREFLRKAGKKPDRFVTPDGRTFSVDATRGASKNKKTS